MLARREYASAELAAALTRKGYAPHVIPEVVSGLQEERLLDDVRYSESLVRMLAGRGQGPRRVRQTLSQAGLAEPLIEAALDAAPDWGQLAAQVRQRKFGVRRPTDWPNRARQMRFLQYRGFSTDHIASALGSSGADDSTAEPTEPDS